LDAPGDAAWGVSHHYPEVEVEGGGPLQAFAVSFFPDHNGVISVVCRPVGEVPAFGGTKTDALDMTLRAVQAALADRASLRAGLR
jgi:hypothetical protein